MSELKRKLAAGEFIVAPGVFDGVSARIADRMGFDALYMTGYGVVASSMGLPDAGLASYRDMVERVSMLAGAAKKYPVVLWLPHILKYKKSSNVVAKNSMLESAMRNTKDRK